MLKLVQTDWGVFDVAIDDPALGDVDAAAATLIYGVLFTDAEAPASRADTFDRRGWWSDAQAGTGLWHVRRQPLNSAARQEAIAMVQAALTIRAPALTGVEVQEVTQTAASGNVSSVVLQITGFHNGRKFIVEAPL